MTLFTLQEVQLLACLVDDLRKQMRWLKDGHWIVAYEGLDLQRLHMTLKDEIRRREQNSPLAKKYPYDPISGEALDG